MTSPDAAGLCERTIVWSKSPYGLCSVCSGVVLEERSGHVEDGSGDAVEGTGVALAVARDQEIAIREEGQSVPAETIVAARGLDGARGQDELIPVPEPLLRTLGTVVVDRPVRRRVRLVHILRLIGEAVSPRGQMAPDVGRHPSTVFVLEVGSMMPLAERRVGLDGVEVATRLEVGRMDVIHTALLPATIRTPRRQAELVAHDPSSVVLGWGQDEELALAIPGDPERVIRVDDDGLGTVLVAEGRAAREEPNALGSMVGATDPVDPAVESAALCQGRDDHEADGGFEVGGHGDDIDTFVDVGGAHADWLEAELELGDPFGGRDREAFVLAGIALCHGDQVRGRHSHGKPRVFVEPSQWHCATK